MEDDEEIQSQPSPASGSPAPSRPNGRITVTVASTATAVAPPQNTLTLALPIQQPRNTATATGGGGGGGGREDCWSEGATAVLIDAWGERYLELSRGNLKQKHWKDVADIVASREGHTKTPKTDVQCKNRIDTVKKKYKTEKAKIAAGGGPSKWRFYDRLDELIGLTANQKIPIAIPVGLRSINKFQPNQKQNQKTQQSRKRALTDSDSSDTEPTPESTDSLPPPVTVERKRRPMVGKEVNSNMVRERNWGNSVRELTRAILKFGETYEQAESSKIQQLVEMEKQRMKFTKEVELQRMQFFMKTQLEISQLKHNRRVGNSNNHNNNNNNVKMNNNCNNSDSSS